MKTSGDRVIARDRVIGFASGVSSVAPKPLARDKSRSESSIQRIILQGLKRFSFVLRVALREIFDENAYERFLQRTCAPRSVESYRKFLREREDSMARKARCC